MANYVCELNLGDIISPVLCKINVTSFSNKLTCTYLFKQGIVMKSNKIQRIQYLCCVVEIVYGISENTALFVIWKDMSNLLQTYFVLEEIYYLYISINNCGLQNEHICW